MRWVALVACLTLAGCLGGSQGPGPAPPVEVPVPEASEVLLDTAGCDGVAVAFLVDFEDVMPWLPAGFHPRDASHLFDSGASVDRVPVFLAGLSCPGTGPLVDFGFTAVFVYPPAVEHPLLGDASQYDFYAPEHQTTDPFLGSLWREAGIVVQDHAVHADTDVLVPSGSARGTLEVLQGGRTLASVDAAAPLPVPAATPNVGFSDWLMRIWSTGDAGLTFMEYGFTHDIPVGGASCSFTPDLVVARMIGRTDCMPADAQTGADGADPILTALFPAIDVQARFVDLPGVRAA